MTKMDINNLAPFVPYNDAIELMLDDIRPFDTIRILITDRSNLYRPHLTVQAARV